MWFEQKPVGPEWAEVAPFHFRNEVDLAAPPAAVFDLLVGTESWPHFMPDLIEVKWVTKGPPAVGSERHAILKTQQVIEHFTVYEPGARWTFYVSRSTLPLVTHFMEDYKLTALPDGGTRLEWLVYYRPRTLVRPLHPVLKPIFAKMFRDGAANLRQYVAKGAARAA